MKPGHYLLFALLFSIVAIMEKCKNASGDVPFPENGSEYTRPVTRKLTFSAPKNLHWETVNKDTIKPAPSAKFDFNRIPSGPIKMGGPRPLLASIPEWKLDVSRQPAAPFNLNKAPCQKLHLKSFPLGRPRKIKAGFRILKEGSPENILVFGQDQGLPGTQVFSFCHDKSGAMWIGTDNGLCRYDGEYCEIYSVVQGLSTNYETLVFADSKGLLWLSHLGTAVDILDIKAGTIRHLTKADGLGGQQAFSFTEDTHGRVWIGNNDGLDVVDFKEGTIRSADDIMWWRGKYVNTLLMDSRKRIWVGGNENRIQLIDLQKGIVQTIALPTAANDVVQFLEDKNGRMWFGTYDKGVYVIDEKAARVKQLTIKQGLCSNNISCLAQGDTGEVFIGTNGGGFDIFDSRNTTVKNLNTYRGLGNSYILSILFVGDGQVWTGTRGKGVNIYNSYSAISNINSMQNLGNKAMKYTAFVQDARGRVWAASEGGGIDIIDQDSQTIKHLGIQEGLISNETYSLLRDSASKIWAGELHGVNIIDEKKGTISRMTEEQGLRGGAAFSMLQDRDGQLWIGKQGITIVNEKTKTVKYTNFFMGLSANDFYAILQDKNGQFWCGSDGGLDIISSDGKTIRNINKLLGPGKNWVTSLLEDSRGNIWIGTHGLGLFALCQETGIITAFSLNSGLTDMHILSLKEKNNKIYAGTEKGLTVISPKSGQLNEKDKAGWDLRSYDKPQGFLNVDFSPAALVTRDEKLWWGISDIITIMKECRTGSLGPVTYIASLDIMEQPQYFDAKQRQGPADSFYTGKFDSLYYEGNELTSRDYMPAKNISWDSTTGLGNIPVNLKLPFDKNHITFHFISNHLDNLNKIRYRFFLAGNDKRWSDITDKPFADYRNLSPGTYIFKVSSKGFDGAWSKPAELRFAITPPGWQTWWAYTCYLLIFVTAIRYYIVFRSRKLKAENVHLEEKVIERTLDLKKSLEELKATQKQLIQSEKMASLGTLTAGIAHEIQNPLNFVNNFSEVSNELIDEAKEEISNDNKEDAISILDDIKQNLQKVIHHGKRADAIVKGMLQHSRKSTAGVKELTDVNALAEEYLRLSLHGLRAKDKTFNAEIKTDFDSTIGKINIIPQDIGRVLLNLFNNAFYAVTERQKVEGEGYKPEVSVATIRIGDKMEIRVADNGAGIPQNIIDKIFQPFFTTKPTGQGTGLGLSLSYDIVKAHGGEIRVETKEGEGTQFIIMLPTE